MARLEIRPEAEFDALETMLWHEGERDGLGAEFLQALRVTFVRIEEGPLQFPMVSRSFRRAIVHRFPFGVFFTTEAEQATVMAITHLHQGSETMAASRVDIRGVRPNAWHSPLVRP